MYLIFTVLHGDFTPELTNYMNAYYHLKQQYLNEMEIKFYNECLFVIIAQRVHLRCCSDT